MEFDKEAFRDYGKGSQEDELVISSKWNESEQQQLIQGMMALRQTKKSTAVKQLVKIGLAKVLSESKILESALENHRKNTRLGLGDIEKTIRGSFKKDSKL